MYLTTNGQMQADAARHVYQWAHSTARSLAEAGQIPNTAAAINEKFAELAIRGLTERGIPISRRLAALMPTSANAAQTSLTAASSVVSEGGKQSALQAAKSGAVNSLQAGAGAAGAFFVLSMSYDLYKLLNDDIDGGEFGCRVAENVAVGVGGWGGAAAGAAAFGAAGSVVPVFGTAAGVVVGGILGSIGGATALKKIVGGIFRGW
jgi:hypothetical protein